jgi:antibiotic biosynthesis monooxygenase (ABM) superfamily enzyme
MSAPAVLIASARLRPGEGQAFAAWQARHNVVLGKFPGFVSSDVIPPLQPEGNEWTIVLNFRSQDKLTAWQRSSERAQIVGEALPLFEGGSLGEVAQTDRPGDPPGSSHRSDPLQDQARDGRPVPGMGGQNPGRPG